MKCDSEIKTLGAWNTCDSETCTFRGWQPLSGEYVEFAREPCDRPTTKTQPKPRDALAPGGVILALLAFAVYRDLRAKRRKRKPNRQPLPDPPENPDPSENPAIRLALDPRIVEITRTVGAGLALPLVLSDDYVADLERAPHVLVAGASGSGKSVALHAIVQGLLAAGQSELVLIDPKMVEAAPYASHPRATVHYRDTAETALARAVAEMERRYRAMLRMRVRAWEGGAIVVVIDEFSDLILGTDRKRAKRTEKTIVRLAQMGRAAGVHLILATQRPSADVISPLIRANILARLALRCTSASDSRIIRGDSLAYDGLPSGPGYAIWNDGDRVVRAPFVDPYSTKHPGAR